MASKRRNEHAQLRREEYESMMDDDKSAETGGLARASDDAIAKRRIVTARGSKRSATAATPAPSAPAPANPIAASFKPAPASSSSSSSNPFAGFGGLTTPAAPPAASNSFSAFKGLTSAAAPPAASDSFSAFKGLTSAAPATTSAGFQGILPPATTTQPSTAAAPSKKGFSFPWIEAKVANKTRDEAKAVCMELLNKEFFAFVQQQVVENPMALWTTPIQEYAQHVASLEKDLDHLYGAKPVETKQATTGGGFTFGVPTPSTKALPVATPPTSKTGGFTIGATTSNTDSAPASKSSGFTFGAKNDTPSTLSKSTTDTAPKSTGFTFGAQNDTPSTFGDTSKSTTDTAPKSTGFTFGGKTDTPSTFGASPKSTGFTFGQPAKEESPAKAATSESSKPSTTGFSFGNAAGGGSLFGAKPAGGAAPSTFASAPAAFSFGEPKAAAAAPVSSGFAFNLPNKQPAAAAAPAANDDDDDDENIGREEATVILKSDSEADETVLFEEPDVRLRQFKAAEKEWADLGAHPLKLLQNKTTKAARIVIRNSIGKIMLNAALFAGMSVQVKRKSVLIPLMHDGKICNFLFTIPPERIDAFKTELEKNTPK